jgi:ribosome-associated translation inhibitor RaiA
MYSRETIYLSIDRAPAYSGGGSDHNLGGEWMKLRLASQGVPLTDELKEYVKRRLGFGLGRLAGRIKSVSIRLADVNGPRGGVDKCCEIRVDAGLRNDVYVRERQTGIHAAIAFATDRARRAVWRQLRLACPGGRHGESLRTDFGGFRA